MAPKDLGVPRLCSALIPPQFAIHNRPTNAVYLVAGPGSPTEALKAYLPYVKYPRRPLNICVARVEIATGVLAAKRAWRKPLETTRFMRPAIPNLRFLPVPIRDLTA